jgi:hypothetical protein
MEQLGRGWGGTGGSIQVFQAVTAVWKLVCVCVNSRCSSARKSKWSKQMRKDLDSAGVGMARSCGRSGHP